MLTIQTPRDADRRRWRLVCGFRNSRPSDGDASARVGVQVLNPRVYLAGAYLWTSSNYGYPRMTGAGFGLEKLPDLDQTSVSLFGSAYYYPVVQGNFTESGNRFERSLPSRIASCNIRPASPGTRRSVSPNKAASLWKRASWGTQRSTSSSSRPTAITPVARFGGIGIHF